MAGPTVSITASGNTSCYAGCDGFAASLAAGGTSPYTYTWDDPLGQSTSIATNLCAGTYIIEIKDSNSCVASAPITISQPDSLIYNPGYSDPICFNDCNGSVGVSVAGGTAPYSYLWNDPGSQTTATALNLCSGVYNSVITDNNGCFVFASITLTDPPPMTSSVAVTNESCLNLCDGSATASATNGTLPLTYLWDDP
ncbi:MAG: SprB repeat-containing protein, partial [Flavobacteriales bacterium]|nr:SprB repeat-containing protein [Flavobacteriales bacterium]